MRRAPRVVVTGLGAVSAWGWGVDALWRGLCSGRTSIGPFDRWDAAGYPTHLASQVPAPPAELPGRVPGWRRLSIADRFAVAATREALAHARVPSDLVAKSGVYVGCCTGGMFESESFYARVRGAEDGRPRLDQLVSQQVNGPGEAAARDAGIGGPIRTVSSACASGALAVGVALDAIRSGEVQSALVGGADSLCRTTYGGFNALRSVDPAASRPFQTGRQGISLGEGGAMLFLETIEGALARGAEPLAEVLGAGGSSDAYHMTAPHPRGDGAARALAEALRDADVSPDAVGFVNAHGTGTTLNDLAEWHALGTVFGSRAGAIPLTATKAVVGHWLGSAGAVEALATVLCLTRGRVHPTPATEAIDPETPVRLVTVDDGVVDAGEIGVSLNLGFGGCNAAVVCSRLATAP